MNMQQLALFGGSKVIDYPLKRYNSIGNEELEAAKEVIASGCLSQFVGSWCSDFYGGPKVREFEKACADYFGVKHAVSVNSWTSGLIAAVGAAGIEPGDEVIVPTWTMCASASAILAWNAIPVFADIDPKTLNIDPKDIERKITSKTKAIYAVHMHGLPADMDPIMALAEKHNLVVIEDAAR